MILVGMICGLYGAKNKFYFLWLMLFNTMFSIYLAVMLTPTVIEMIPQGQEEPYHKAISMALLFTIAFAALFTLTNHFFDKTFPVILPKFFDGVGSGILGFVVGYMLAAFFLFIVCILPFTGGKYVEGNIKPLAQRSVTKTCKFINNYSLHCNNHKVEKVVDELFAAKIVEEPNQPESKLTSSSL